MSAVFVSASSQYLLNSITPITAAPFTASFWFKMPTSGSYTIPWGITDTGASGNDWYVAKETGNTISFNGDQGASFFTATCATAIITNAWTFCAVREITSSNHRISILHATGLIEHAADTTAITPASIDSESIGALVGAAGTYIDGSVAERSLWNADVQGDGAQLQNSTLRRMAYGGPFALPHMIKNLVEYRSLRSSLVSASDRPNEIYVGAGKPPQVWTNVNAAKLGPHVPLPLGYVKQFQGARLMPVL